LAQNQLCGFHNKSSDLTHLTSEFWADFEGKGKVKWIYIAPSRETSKGAFH